MEDLVATKRWQALLGERFPGTVFSRESKLSRSVYLGLEIASFVVFALLFMLGSIAIAGAIAGSSSAFPHLPWEAIAAFPASFLPWLFIATVCDSYLVQVPHTLLVNGNRWVEGTELVLVPEHPDHFATPTGTLIKVERNELHCTAVTVKALPEVLLAQEKADKARAKSAVEAERRATAAWGLINQDRLDAARGLIDGQVDEWRLA